MSWFQIQFVVSNRRIAMAMMKWCSIIVCLLTVGTKELRYVWCVFVMSMFTLFSRVMLHV